MSRFGGFSRRRFVQFAGGALGALLAPVVAEAHPRRPPRRPRLGLRMYRWSGRGRRASKAALAHAANRRYATKRAPLRDLPHPGAKLKLVQLDVSVADYVRLFIRRRRAVVDLRRI